jgi:2-hydroxymuconate-semialdehyde hydrolase
LVIDRLAPTHRLLAPDFAGFGFTAVPPGTTYNRTLWLDQMVGFMDAIGLDKASIVGNSFGGSMALAMAIAHPERVAKLILMGSVGVPFPITEGLDAVWGYEPSRESTKL